MSNLTNNTRALEDAFFLAEDRILVEKLKEMKKLKETRETLRAVSGISDEAVLDKMIKLGIQSETLASLAVIPLIEVAWADGQVDEKEKAAILKSLDEAAFAKNLDRVLVEQWLLHRPKPALLEAWTVYSQALAKELTAEERRSLREDLLGHAHFVAESSGGFLGLGTVSAAERSMLEHLAKAWAD